MLSVAHVHNLSVVIPRPIPSDGIHLCSENVHARPLGCARLCFAASRVQRVEDCFIFLNLDAFGTRPIDK